MRTELEFHELNENIEWSETNEGRKAQGTIYICIYVSISSLISSLFVCSSTSISSSATAATKEKKEKQSKAKPSQGRKWMEETNLNQSKQKPNQTKPFIFFSFCSLHLSHPPTITSSQVTQIFSFDPDHLSQTDLCTFNICVKIT